jgi:hypothetical protein
MQDCTVLSNVMGSRNAPIKLVTELPEPNNPPPPPLESEVDDPLRNTPQPDCSRHILSCLLPKAVLKNEMKVRWTEREKLG